MFYIYLKWYCQWLLQFVNILFCLKNKSCSPPPSFPVCEIHTLQVPVQQFLKENIKNKNELHVTTSIDLGRLKEHENRTVFL